MGKSIDTQQSKLTEEKSCALFANILVISQKSYEWLHKKTQNIKHEFRRHSLLPEKLYFL